MKNIILASLVATLLLFAGCSQKSTPVVDMTGKDGSGIYDADAKLPGAGIDKERVSESEELANRLAKVIAQLEENTQKIYFEFDKYTISPNMQSAIEYNAKLFNTAEALQFTIKVEGNCDEWGTDEYNYALGLKRAKSVKDALIAQGISVDRVTVVSFGESNPECSESNQFCWDKNRRAEFKLLP